LTDKGGPSKDVVAPDPVTAVYRPNDLRDTLRRMRRLIRLWGASLQERTAAVWKAYPPLLKPLNPPAF
jgi:hypothetical protein